MCAGGTGGTGEVNYYFSSPITGLVFDKSSKYYHAEGKQSQNNIIHHLSLTLSPPSMGEFSDWSLSSEHYGDLGGVWSLYVPHFLPKLCNRWT